MHGTRACGKTGYSDMLRFYLDAWLKTVNDQEVAKAISRRVLEHVGLSDFTLLAPAVNDGAAWFDRGGKRVAELQVQGGVITVSLGGITLLAREVHADSIEEAAYSIAYLMCAARDTDC
jgi:hypothetical protein